MNPITQYCPKNISIDAAELISAPLKPLAVFAHETTSFLNKVSRLLLTDKNYNRIPEIAALGFWLRNANLEEMRKENSHWLNSSNYSVNPVGRVFHVAPSNVDTIFLYSLCISLLMGNSNIVRVSSAPLTPTAEFIISCINNALSENEFTLLKEYIKIITYSHDESINTFFSTHANCRVIWGGDATVLHFKNIPAPVYSKDILFPNRISYSVFKAAAFIRSDSETKQAAANDFFNDSYTFDQLGCSSPKVIFVMGSEEEKNIFAKEFYSCLSAIAGKRYHNQASLLAVRKFNHLADDIISNKVIQAEHGNNAVYMVETKDESLKFESCYGGYFYIRHIGVEAFQPLQKMVSESVQTLTWFGLDKDELAELNRALYGKRVDRIVPVGQALSFHYIWDGMNLFEELSRKRVIKG